MSESPANIDRIRAWLVATCGMYRSAFERRRWIVPVDALYEWKVDEGRKQPTAPRQPNSHQGRPFESTVATPWVDRWEAM
jgi:putative SOS response-associated peptidase YedK